MLHRHTSFLKYCFKRKYVFIILLFIRFIDQCFKKVWTMLVKVELISLLMDLIFAQTQYINVLFLINCKDFRMLYLFAKKLPCFFFINGFLESKYSAFIILSKMLYNVRQLLSSLIIYVIFRAYYSRTSD